MEGSYSYTRIPSMENKAEDTWKYLQMYIYVIFEPALLLYMLLLSIALKTSQFQIRKMKSGMYNLSNCMQWYKETQN